MVAAAGIGAGDVVSSTMAASAHGLTLLWAVVLAAFLKSFLNEGIARWQLATGLTALEGWARYLPWWVRVYFAIYLVIWTVSVSAALTSACGLAIANVTSGAVPRPWGAIGHSLIGGVLVFAGGFSAFEKVMKVLIATMFFAIVGCAVLTVGDPGDVARGFVPHLDTEAGSTVLSVLGGIGGSIAMLAYNYWLREEHMLGPQWLRPVRIDIAIAYVFTAIFGIAIMIVANQAFHVAGVEISNAQAVTKMAETLGTMIGPLGFYAYSIGFYAAVFASLLGVWQSIPYLFADHYRIPYRFGLLFITLTPLPFAFIDQPLIIIRTFTIVGSLFIPFLAATLLYLNNAHIPPDSEVPRNSPGTNIVLVLALVVFAIVGASEAGLL